MPYVSVYLEKEEEEIIKNLMPKFGVSSKSDAAREIIRRFLKDHIERRERETNGVQKKGVQKD